MMHTGPIGLLMPRAFLVSCLGAAILVPQSAAALVVAPFSFDTAFGRLPKTVVPTAYSISIKPDATGRTLSGSESIAVEFREATATIVLNSLNEVLRDVRLDGTPVQNVVSDNDQQLTTIALATPAAKGPHTLTFSFDGKMETGPRGLFAQPYVTPQGEKGLLISTKFESTDARRMFPCWDEPAFRATFELSATVPAKWAVVSNMPIAQRVLQDDLATTTFQRSPKMPTYLVEFSAGDLAEISAQMGPTRVGIWAVRGQEQSGRIALENAEQILADYNDYFGYPYPLPKLDSIAIPGGFSGAMENWGAITYNDQLLLVTPASTERNRQVVFGVQAHEMAHQWNGDLVTMSWWDDIWLNESFASWRATQETDLRHPTWKIWEAEDAKKEGAMSADARATSHAIQQHVSDELQVTNAFDPAITYSKGEAVLRMFETYLGRDAFRDGVRRFMRSHAFSNATSTDLWNALSAASGTDVGTIAADWIEQPGFPLVSVEATCDAEGRRSIRLSQRRFLLQDSSTAASHWSIPLQIRLGPDEGPQPLLLTEARQFAAAGRCDQTLSVNAGATGFYRVEYDSATLRANVNGFAKLPDPDRIVLLDDQWALVQAGRQKLAGYLALGQAMGDDLDERAWNQITSALGELETDTRGLPEHEAFAGFARSVIKPVATRLGWDARSGESPGTQQLRRNLLSDLGAWGDTEVIAEARRRFAAFLSDRTSIRPDDQSLVLSIVARNADTATFAQLHEMARSAKDETEMSRFYQALVRVRDPGLAAQAAQIVVSPEIPPQAAATRLGLVFEMARESPRVAWNAFTEHFDMLMVSQGRYAPLITAQASPEVFWNAVPLPELESWINAHVPAEMGESVARGMEAARFSLGKKAALGQAAKSFIDERKGNT